MKYIHFNAQMICTITFGLDDSFPSKGNSYTIYTWAGSILLLYLRLFWYRLHWDRTIPFNLVVAYIVSDFYFGDGSRKETLNAGQN